MGRVCVIKCEFYILSRKATSDSKQMFIGRFKTKKKRAAQQSCVARGGRGGE